MEFTALQGVALENLDALLKLAPMASISVEVFSLWLDVFGVASFMLELLAGWIGYRESEDEAPASWRMRAFALFLGAISLGVVFYSLLLNISEVSPTDLMYRSFRLEDRRLLYLTVFACVWICLYLSFEERRLHLVIVSLVFSVVGVLLAGFIALEFLSFLDTGQDWPDLLGFVLLSLGVVSAVCILAYAVAALVSRGEGARPWRPGVIAHLIAFVLYAALLIPVCILADFLAPFARNLSGLVALAQGSYEGEGYRLECKYNIMLMATDAHLYIDDDSSLNRHIRLHYDASKKVDSFKIYDSSDDLYIVAQGVDGRDVPELLDFSRENDDEVMVEQFLYGFPGEPVAACSRYEGDYSLFFVYEYDKVNGTTRTTKMSNYTAEGVEEMYIRYDYEGKQEGDAPDMYTSLYGSPEFQITYQDIEAVASLADEKASE